MSAFNHAICDPCWEKRSPGRVPHRLVVGGLEVCCWCGHETGSGIYVREDPSKVPMCSGHEED